MHLPRVRTQKFYLLVSQVYGMVTEAMENFGMSVMLAWHLLEVLLLKCYFS
jgi:hypothetical protein